MLSGIINSKKAINMNIAIMRAFVELRRVLLIKTDFKHQFLLGCQGSPPKMGVWPAVIVGTAKVDFANLDCGAGPPKYVSVFGFVPVSCGAGCCPG